MQEETIFAKLNNGTALDSILELWVSGLETDIVIVCDSAFSKPTLFCETGVKYHIQNKKAYIYLEDDAPGISDEIAKYFDPQHVKAVCQKEAVYAKEMVENLKTKQGRKRFLDVFMQEIADKNLKTIPGHLGGHLMARAFIQRRRQTIIDETLYIGIPSSFQKIEIRTGRGRVFVLSGSKDGHIQKLFCKTLSGDMELKNLKIDRMELISSSGDTIVTNIENKKMNLHSLNGEVKLTDIVSKHIYIEALHGGVFMSSLNCRSLETNQKAGECLAKEIICRQWNLNITSASLDAKAVRARFVDGKSTLGDMQFSFASDVDASLSTLSGDLNLELENEYQGFTAKIEDQSESKKRLKTTVLYGRMKREYVGDCKFAVNQRSSKLKLCSKGNRIYIRGSNKKAGNTGENDIK